MPAKTVAVELVEKAGINVKTLLNLLISNASAELTTFYYYTILRVNLIGLERQDRRSQSFRGSGAPHLRTRRQAP
jgi:ferritin-like protein